ncbi:MAG TPA: S9 family peptidase [Candidatus Tidjanibacter faecipullorum]|uniref:S9 family peptidase n=1 Tax=Candidatus Tidjanibacter faecipullorum TaxID=2838766 RepID=A0A9D2IKW5_9BACT|nr:S9 family peptidase [Candidatus Tidjanibacter faecipullorum]
MAAAVTASCSGDGGRKGSEPLVIDNSLTEEEIAAGILTPEVLWKMGRLGESTLSPDGKTVLYSVTWYNMTENRGVTNLFTVPSAGGEATQLTDNGGSDFAPAWSADGKTIYFLSDRSGDNQLWAMNADGSKMRQLSHIEGGLEGFGVAPTGDRFFYVQSVHAADTQGKDIYPDMDKSGVLIYSDLMARHWNYWDRGSYRHIFVGDLTAKEAKTGTDIMAGEAWDAPMAPYFDMSEIVWNNAGTQIAYTSKKLTGTEYATTTDSDIYVYDVTTGQTININKAGTPNDPRLRIAPAFPGYDKYPVFSPDDRYIAFQSMRRGGNEADKTRLFVWDSTNGSFRDLTEAFDYNTSNVVWSSNEEIMFIAPMNGTHQICTVTLAEEPQVKVCTKGDHDITRFSYEQGVCVAEITTQRQAAELFRVNGSQLIQLTFVNKDIYDHITMGEVQKRWIQTTDGKQMLTWVILPPNFDPNKKYPTLLYCEGGPQSVISQMWSYRWNFQLMAAQGYVIVAPNRRGTVSFGQEWTDQISGDYSGQNIQDYLVAIDEVSKEPWVDKDHRGCVGASYGGYSVYYLAGVHEGRFKAFISHCGIYDFDSMFGSTEELFFVNHEYGGPYWDKTNATAQRSYANSPHKLAQNWDTPIMIITGLKDYRIPYTQSLEAFTAARLQGIPARLVAFEEEGHQVFQPQNSMVWNREFFGWLDKYLK